jgi:hypothetical protein
MLHDVTSADVVGRKMAEAAGGAPSTSSGGGGGGGGGGRKRSNVVRRKETGWVGTTGDRGGRT